MLKHPKILSAADLPRSVALCRNSAKRIVFTNGCFDILHPGHVDLLARARLLGDVLFLGVNSDGSVRRLGKAPDRPVNTLESRAFVLAHLASVDYVVPFEEDTPLRLIETIVPDVLVKGGDWAVESIVGREIVQENGGEVFSLPLLSGFSTTSLIARIQSGVKSV